MKTILVVDNSLHDLNRVKEVLNRCRYRVIAGQNGLSAPSALGDEGPADLLLIQLRTPDMDGLEFVSTIKKPIPRTPTILLTAYSNHDTNIKTLSMDAFEYLNKPIMFYEHRKVDKAPIDGPQQDGASLIY
jgi:two-component system NtrC family response regulator